MGGIATAVGKQVSNLAPVLNRLVDPGFVLRHFDPVRASYGTLAARARLLLLGSRCDLDASSRPDVEIVDLDRLYEGH